jgi:hypothetical protein
VAGTVLLFALGYGVSFLLGLGEGALRDWAQHLSRELDSTYFYAHLLWRAARLITSAYSLALNGALVITLVAAFVRPLSARRRIARPGSRGMLADFAARHPVLANRVVPWVPGVLWIAAVACSEGPQIVGEPGALLGFFVGLFGIAAAVRFAVRGLGTESAPVHGTSSEDQSSFAAVAVTPATLGAVGALAAASVAMMAFAVVGRSTAQVGTAIFAYTLAAMAIPTLFRRLSRIVVGIDGVLVQGTDKARFFGYATLDDARQSGGDILLVRQGRTVLRLQLHDADVMRAPTLVARLRAAMDHAARMRGEGADLLMQATQAAQASSGGSSASSLASSSRGGRDYRQPAMAREHLWQLIEGPVSDRNARTAAAQALGSDLSTEERGRLRVAVDKCAEPRVRVALQKILDTSEADASEDHETETDEACAPRRALPIGLPNGR